ncbi:MAG: hypothetical protein ABFD54_12425 [Armatimonadota bacterium]|nr:hypothetical protein [bacterium]
MKMILKYALLVMVITAASVASCTADKITVDPNSPEGKANAEAGKLITDTRLAQKITYNAKHKTVQEILSDLSGMTGVTLSAGWNVKDWQVRDRRMNIFAREAALADLMSSIARVMKFKWQTGDSENTPTYRLYMDRKTLLDSDAQAQREQDRLNREIAEKREKMFESYGKLGQLSQSDLAALKQENPFMYVAATSGIAGGLGQFFQSVPAAMDALSTGQELSMGGGNLSASAQQGLLQSVSAIAQMASKVTGGRGPKLPDDLSSNMSQINININRNLEDLNATPMRGMMLGQIGVKVGGDSIDIPLFDPDSKMAKLLGKALVKSDEEGKPLKDVMKDMQGEMIAAVMSEIQSNDTGEPLNEHPEDPDLAKKIKMNVETPGFDGVLAALADASEFSVVSDRFDSQRMPMNISSDESELSAVLEKITDGYHYNWDKRKTVLEFRDRNWYSKRQAQIPQAWIDDWKSTLKETGTLDIDDLASIAQLTQEQFNMNIMDDEDLLKSGLIGVIYQNRDILRMYASLGEGQRDLALTGTGIDLKTATSPSQWLQVDKLIRRYGGDQAQDESQHFTMSGSRTSIGKTHQYTFTLKNSDGTELKKWIFTTPTYQEPKKEQPDKAPEKAK